jgi:hypothetical protein
MSDSTVIDPGRRGGAFAPFEQSGCDGIEA